MTAKIELKNISKTYSNSRNLNVLNDICFEINEGETVSIYGPSGCGKTTLAQIIAGLIKPSSGQILINNRIIEKPIKEVSFVFQDAALLPWKDVLSNVTFGLVNQNILTKAEKEIKALQYIEMVGLRGFEDFYPVQLSGGMKSRVSLARALVRDPEILILDEPFGALDVDIRESLQDVLLELQQVLKKTFVLISHSADEVTYLSNRVIILSALPAKIKETIEIDFAVRNPDIRASSEFFDYKNRIWNKQKNND